MSEFFKQIGMPSKLADFNIDKEKAERLAELCTYGRTRTVKNYIPLGFEEIKEIFLSC